VSINTQEKQSGLQAHVDEREQGQNNSINAQYTNTDFLTVVQT